MSVDRPHLETSLRCRCRRMTPRPAPAKVPRLVVAKIDSDDDVRRIADEPRVLPVVGRAGLACHGLSNLTHDGRCPSLDNAFHHRRDLIGSHGIENLLPPIDQRRFGLIFPFLAGTADALTFVVLVDGMAVTILDAL